MEHVPFACNKPHCNHSVIEAGEILGQITPVAEVCVEEETDMQEGQGYKHPDRTVDTCVLSV